MARYSWSILTTTFFAALKTVFGANPIKLKTQPFVAWEVGRNIR